MSFYLKLKDRFLKLMFELTYQTSLLKLSESERERAQLTNILAVSFSLLVPPNIIFYSLLDYSWISLGLCLPFFLFYSSIYLNAKGFENAAKWNLILTANITVILMSLLLGRESYIHWILTPLVITPTLLFDKHQHQIKCRMPQLLSLAAMIWIEFSDIRWIKISPQTLWLVEHASMITLVAAGALQMNLSMNLFRKTKNRLEIAMHVVKFGVWDWNLKNGQLIWDDFMYEVFGIDKSTFTGAYDAFQKTLLPEDAKKVSEELQKTFEKKAEFFSSEFRILRKTNEVRNIRAEAKCFYDDNGSIDRLVGANWDVTEAREQELKLLQASKFSSLGEMSAGIAHEINNPLAIISGKAQIIKALIENQEFDLQKLLKHTESIDFTTQRIAKIVKGLRTFARKDSNDPFESVSLKNIIEDVLSFCHTRFKNHGIVLTLDGINEQTKITCRPTQLSQIFLNLLNNSFDAIEGLAEKWIKIQARDSESEIEISVTDSGSGINPLIQDKIMQPFFTTKEAGKGTGLGLSIASGIVHAHHGHIEIDRKCLNTKFVIRLPKLQATAAPKN